MILKICGMTRIEDIPAALAAGATHLGMIFAPKSPRCLSMEQARILREAIPADVQAVGVFQGTQVKRVLEIANEIRLDAIQLHGGFDAGDAEQVKKAGFPLLWASAVDPNGERSCALEPAVADLLVLDTRAAGHFGGTGAPFDWGKAKRPLRPFLVAGGITPANILEAIHTLKPSGVDLSSGVESRPGIKDHSALDALKRALASASNS